MTSKPSGGAVSGDGRAVADPIDLSARYRDLLALGKDENLLYYQGSWTSLGRLRQAVAGITGLLDCAGLGEGAKIGLVTRTRPAHVAALLAVLSTRRCLVPITSIQSDAGVSADAGRLGLAALIADDEDWARPGLREACSGLGVLGIAVSLGDEATEAAVEGLGTCTADSELVPGTAVLMPTSGTTGPPKRVTYRYDHLNGALGRIARYAPAVGRTLNGPVRLQRGITIATLALAHVGGLWAVLQAAAEGRRMALLDRFEPGQWADLVERHRARLSALPPTAIRMVLDSSVPKEKLSSLLAVNCGTAPLDPAVGDEFTARYGIPVLTAYGATEFPGGLVGWTLGDYRGYHDTKRGSAGRPRPGIKLRIVDPDTGRVRGPGETGLISVLSPQATASTADGWVTTNDIGRLDKDDFLWVLGRADDAINRGGFKIVPQSVEDVLRQHPSVADAAVAGLPDRRLGQVPVAVVTVRGPVELAELTAWARDHLPKYQVPAQFKIVTELPRTTSMKVSKEGVRALFTSAPADTRVK